MSKENLKRGGYAAASVVCSAALCATMVTVPKTAVAEEAAQYQPIHQEVASSQAQQLEVQTGDGGTAANADDAQDKHATKFDFSAFGTMLPVKFNTSAVELREEVCDFLAYNSVLIDEVSGQPVPFGSLVPEDFEVTAADLKTKSVDIRFKGKDGYDECSATGVKLLLTGLEPTWNMELPSDGSGVVALGSQFDFGVTYDAPDEALEDAEFYFEEIDPETGEWSLIEGSPAKPGRYHQYVRVGNQDKGYEEHVLEREFTVVAKRETAFNLGGRMIPVKYDPDGWEMLGDVCEWLADGQNEALIDAETRQPLTGFTEGDFIAFSDEDGYVKGNDIQVTFKGSDLYYSVGFVPAKLYVTDLQLKWNEELPSGNVITQGQQFDFGVTLGAPDDAQSTLKVTYEDAGHNALEGVPTEPGHYFQRATAGNEEAGYQETSIEREFTIVKGEAPSDPKDPAKTAVNPGGNNDNADNPKASSNSQQTPKTSDYGMAFAGAAAAIAACAAAFVAFALRRRRG